MRNYEVLLGKSKRDIVIQEQEKLQGHTRDVFNAAKTLVDCIGKSVIASMNLPDTFFDLLRQSLLRGALMHDLGKANHQFQCILHDGYSLPQALRHEWISAWLPLRFKEFDRWLFGGCEEIVRYK